MKDVPDPGRRRLLGALACIAAGGMLPVSFAASGGRVVEYPFTLGVASGAPAPDGFVLWTRLAGESVRGEGGVEVRWEVFEEGRPSDIVARGRTLAIADLAHSVHVEVAGLRPDRWYGYRFMTGDAVSAVGRTRTLPAAGAAVDRMRFAFASCQRWEDGYYAAYRHMLEDAPDLVLFLGDYIYEYRSRANPLARSHNLRHARTLGGYRRRYQLYRSDPDLQRMHAACPWLVVWDDHEVQNNYAASLSVAGTENFPARRAAAYQAFYEHMPLRARTLVEGIAGLQRTGTLRIHDRLDYGRLARFHLLDNRQYRDPPLCGDDPGPQLAAVCQQPAEDARTMLGWEQERWLDDGLAQSARQGQQWNVIGQQTVFTPRNYGEGPGRRFARDQWDGYPAARVRLLESIARHRPANPLFVGGDIHQNWVAHVHQDPYDVRSPVLAREFCGTSISSRNTLQQSSAERIAARNPHNVLANSERRGYGLVELAPQRALVRLRVVDDVTRRDSGIATLASFMLLEGGRSIEWA